MAKRHSVHCPTCKTPTDYFEKPVGPFCSNRCQMVDLGKWLNEEYRVSEPLSPTDIELLEEIENQNRS
ncbi:MAG: DNA gyrase inhibitor YacG [Verrucomicrobiota bacterium]